MNKPTPAYVWLLTACLLLTFSFASAQNITGKKKIMPPALKSFVKKATVFTIDPLLFKSLYNSKQKSLELAFDLDGKTLIMELEENNIFSKGFFVKDGLGKIVTYNKDHSLHYKGKIKGDQKSLVALNIYENEINAIIADPEGNINIGPLQDGSKDMIIYRESDLFSKPGFACGALPAPFNSNPLPDISIPASFTEVVNEEPVDIYYEADYSCYTGKGSNLANTISWVTDLANNVSVLYENDSVNVKLSAIKVWTVADPHVSYTSSATALNSFSLAMTNGFPGDLAHLLSRRDLGGGIAYINILCSSAQFRTGLSGNLGNGITPLPAYSWNSMVITHELGHNIGSNHTQWCGWAGGAIDNCYTTEGGCPQGPAPSNGGTIMSYCHLTGYGINLSNGFGPLPGALVRNNVRNSTCIYPRVSYNRASEFVTEETADIDNDCLDYKLVNVKMALNYEASMPAVIHLLPTATLPGLQIGAGKDVEVISALDFTLTDTTAQIISMKVFDDAIIESNESLLLDYTIESNGTNAKKGASYNLVIISNDHRPDSTLNQLVYYESFDNVAGLGNWTQDIIHGNNSPNRWKIGISSDPQFLNNAAYITNNDNIASYSGSSLDDSSVIRLISPAINATGFSNLRLSYLYKCRGEGVAGQGTSLSPVDFGRLYYSANNGVTWTVVTDNIYNRNEKLLGQLNLPSSANNNPNVRIAFEWRNNSSVVNNPPLIIDSIVVVGAGPGPIQSDAHVSNSDTAYVGPNQTVHFYNQVTGKAMATIKNLSAFDFGCTQVDLIRTGTNATGAWGISNAEKLTDKAFKITTSNSNASAPYELSLYATNEEANGWAAATGNAATEMNIIKSATDITQLPIITSPLYSNSNSNTAFAGNGDKIIKGTFTGFSWFGLGKAGIALVCPGNSKQFSANASGTAYQWQVNTGSGFSNISNGAVYAGTGTATLTLSNAPTSWYGYKYRCVITTGTGTEYSYTNELKFATTWKGTVNTLWNVPGNWECGVVPDANTDVFVLTGAPNTPQVNANTSVRTLTVMNGATVTVNNGILFTILK